MIKLEITADTFKELLSKAEAQVYEDAMVVSRFNQCKAAVLLGVSRGTFRTKMKEYFGDKYIGARE